RRIVWSRTTGSTARLVPTSRHWTDCAGHSPAPWPHVQNQSACGTCSATFRVARPPLRTRISWRVLEVEREDEASRPRARSSTRSLHWVTVIRTFRAPPARVVPAIAHRAIVHRTRSIDSMRPSCLHSPLPCAFMGTTPARGRGRLTLGRVFVLAGLGVTLLLGALLTVLLRGWRASAMDQARTLREEASRTIGTEVETE